MTDHDLGGYAIDQSLHPIHIVQRIEPQRANLISHSVFYRLAPLSMHRRPFPLAVVDVKWRRSAPNRPDFRAVDNFPGRRSGLLPSERDARGDEAIPGGFDELRVLH